MRFRIATIMPHGPSQFLATLPHPEPPVGEKHAALSVPTPLHEEEIPEHCRGRWEAWNPSKIVQF